VGFGARRRKDAGLKTATLVLAILANIFGALGAIIALLFGSLAASVSFGLGGTDIARNAAWALAAVALGIVGTVLIGRGPRVAAVLLVIAGVAGILGTASFVVGSVLYVIAAGLALFANSAAPAPRSVAVGMTAPATAGSSPALTGSSDLPVGAVGNESDGGATERPAASSAATAHRSPRLGRRSTRIAGAAAVLVVAIVVVSTIVGQASEQRPATALFDALQAGDDAALAQLLPAGARTGNSSADAQTALRRALGNSVLSFVAEDWLRSFAPATGTKISFENLQTTTVSKTADSGVVRVTGVFSPSNPNPILNTAMQVARIGFTANIQTVRAGTSWYLASSPTATTTGTSPATAGSASTPKPTDRPTPTPSPTRIPLPTTTLDGATFTADFNSAANLPTPGPVNFGTYTLAYQGGHALLNGCKKQFSPDERCFWGVNRPAGFIAVAATATAQAEWGIVLREVRDDWLNTQSLNNAALGSINPRTGQYQVIIVAHPNAGDDARDGGQTVANGVCDCINRDGPNTVEFDIRGAELVLMVNGVAVTRVADTQGLRGSHYGVYWVGGYPDSLTSIDLTYFVGK
jgi:hypothetical protein